MYSINSQLAGPAALSWSRFNPFCGQLAQQKVKVNEAAEGVEVGQHPTHPLVVQGLLEIQPVLQLAAGPHVVAGEEVPAPQTPQQDIFRRPAADALKKAQGFNCVVVVQGVKVFQAGAAGHQILGQFDDGPGLIVAETQVPQGLGLQPRQVLGLGKGVRRPGLLRKRARQRSGSGD